MTFRHQRQTPTLRRTHKSPPKIGRTHSGPKRTISTRRPIIHKSRGVRQKVWLKPVAVGATGSIAGGGIIGTAYATSDTSSPTQLGFQPENQEAIPKRKVSSVLQQRRSHSSVIRGQRQHTTGSKKGPQVISDAGVGKGVFDDIHSTVQSVGADVAYMQDRVMNTTPNMMVENIQQGISDRTSMAGQVVGGALDQVNSFFNPLPEATAQEGKPKNVTSRADVAYMPSSPDPFGGVVAIGQDFYTGASDVVSDFGTTINPASFVEPFFEEPITPATYDKVTGEMLTEAVWKPIPKSKSTIYRLQDAATEQAFHFAFDRPEFERLSQEGTLPFDVAYRQEFSGANKISTARLMGELTAEAGLWVGTFAAGRAIWGVGRGVKLASTASKMITKKGHGGKISIGGKTMNKAYYTGELPEHLVGFPRTKMGGVKKGLMEAIGTTGKDPFMLGWGPSHIPKRIPLLGGRGSTMTQFSLPRAKKIKKPKMKKVSGTIQNRSTRLAKKRNVTSKKVWKPVYEEQKKMISQRWLRKGTKQTKKKTTKKRFPTKKKAKPKAIVKSVNTKRREKAAFRASHSGKPNVSGSGQ